MAQLKSSDLRVVLEIPFHGTKLSFEAGWIAKQAGGAVIARAGDTMVMATVCASPAKAAQDFFPLTVEYQEKYYAAGRIPGGYIKREARPSEQEILTCRLIDRPIRPLFPEGYFEEVQLICTVLSADGINSPDTLAVCASSAALHISDLPFHGPLAAVRVGRSADKKFIINPSKTQLEKSDLDYIIAGTEQAIVMVEGGSQIISEQEVLEALFFGHQELQQIISLQQQLREKVGKVKREVILAQTDQQLLAKVKEVIWSDLQKAYSVENKAERRENIGQLYEKLKTSFTEEVYLEKQKELNSIIEILSSNFVRERILNDKIRIDGRGLANIRPIECEVGIIPRAHGSALFTRGETQAIVTTTLGTSDDAQRIETLSQQIQKTFMLHYNFPPYSTGEVKGLRGTSRREVGHGALAERAVKAVLPSGKDFPYVVRIVSDITESNGSSSMASVCGGSLSLMDAGVKITAPVGGVAMGLIKEGDRVAVLTDILGDEDHLGDMDFKVCGTSEGITALQMDIKCSGLTREIMATALEQARLGRLHILNEMQKTLGQPRTTVSQYAPVIEKIKINPERIKDVIGPGGKTIRSIIETTGVKIDVEDDGTVSISCTDAASGKRAKEIIMGLTEEAEIGKIYTGVVKKIMDFGAFVEILPGTEGLVHISQLDHGRVNQVSDVVREGDEIPVRVLDIDRQGKIRLSRKEALSDQ